MLKLAQTNQQTNQQSKNNMSPTTIVGDINPPPGGHVFLPIQTIIKLNCPIQGVGVGTGDGLVVSSKKNAPPLGSHVFQAKVTIFELIQDIIGTNHLSKFHEDQKINVASRVLTRFYYSHINIIGMNLRTKFYEDRTINVASRVLTRFCYGHTCTSILVYSHTCIRKNALPLGSNVFQISLKTNLLTKVHEDWTINENVDVAQRTTDNGRWTKGDHKSSP
ncbi:hypothetical protein DPMN_007355 [Dreissena polymorpha]|uniref:Uncharacterized protein n=1 Tax=Dreissena polymorpha TaxID=45954 RepID=A0A9D4MU62_DREPO|nr:hypothetical protein DPMN_007355 [Dreissena polymorpha]